MEFTCPNCGEIENTCVCEDIIKLAAIDACLKKISKETPVKYTILWLVTRYPMLNYSEIAEISNQVYAKLGKITHSTSSTVLWYNSQYLYKQYRLEYDSGQDITFYWQDSYTNEDKDMIISSELLTWMHGDYTDSKYASTKQIEETISQVKASPGGAYMAVYDIE